MIYRFGSALLLYLSITSTSFAGFIVAGDIVGTQTLVSSGNGTLDVRLMTFSGSEIGNSSGAYNADNGNNTLPQSGGADTSLFAESYFTTAGEVKNFYRLNFPDGLGGSTLSQLVIFLDLNETGGGQTINHLEKVEIVLNPTTVGGNPNPLGDLSSAAQSSIDQNYTGGTVLAQLATTPLILPINAQGAGHADYAIFTGINPFLLNDADSLLFNISMSHLNNGAEEIFLSGEFAPVPEPSAALLLGVAGGCLLMQRRSVRRRA